MVEEVGKRLLLEKFWLGTSCMGEEAAEMNGPRVLAGTVGEGWAGIWAAWAQQKKGDSVSHPSEASPSLW